MKKITDKSLLLGCIGCLTISSLMIFFVPLAVNSMEKGKNILAYITAIIFWLTIFMGYGLFFVCQRTIDKSEQKRKIPVATNYVGMGMNGLFLLSFLGYLVTQVIFKLNAGFGYVFIFLFVLAFHFQIVFNSQTFMKVFNIQGRRK